ncbi:hypothetical protein TNCV_4868031 [Trichonephila clavipes]|nr:hypothetical protein TNCV_4868031 [Trichonephila clavipes]
MPAEKSAWSLDHGSKLRGSSPKVNIHSLNLVVGLRGREVGGPSPPPGVLPQNCGGNKPNRTATCMVLKAMANDRRHLALCHEFRGPRSGLCRSGGISNSNNSCL